MTAVTAAQVRISFDQARPVVEAMPSNLPAPLRGLSAADIEGRWPAWVERHDRDVRARLARGDEDSVVNWWLYGTTFTSLPPATAQQAARAGIPAERLALDRLEHFLDALDSESPSERVRFARHVLAGRKIDPSTGAGRSRARQFLLDVRARMTAEFAATDRLLASAARDSTGAATTSAATIFRERGLSSDTSILADYSVAVALESIAKQDRLRAGQVRRVAIVGPGLDFTNKVDGYDFYPQQTIQPFALSDTLRRTGLAASDLQIVTFDISERVNHHLAAAVEQAGSARGYVLTLPLDADEQWSAGLLAYWEGFGRTIGAETTAMRPPSSTGPVRVRAVTVRPEVVRSIAAHDMNIVVDRPPLAAEERRQGVPADRERFDLVVATNVLVYYDVFEQALAVANIASMLRPGGVFLTNTAVLPTPPLKPSASYLRVAHTAQRYDELFWYQRD